MIEIIAEETFVCFQIIHPDFFGDHFRSFTSQEVKNSGGDFCLKRFLFLVFESSKNRAGIQDTFWYTVFSTLSTKGFTIVLFNQRGTVGADRSNSGDKQLDINKKTLNLEMKRISLRR